MENEKEKRVLTKSNLKELKELRNIKIKTNNSKECHQKDDFEYIETHYNINK